MSFWISKNGQNYGPYTLQQLETWLAEGKVDQHDAAWAQGNEWRPLGDLLREAGCVIPPPHARSAGLSANGLTAGGSPPEVTIRRIADYERISGILWIVLGVVQCITLVGIVAGIWNIFAGVSRRKAVIAVLARDPGVPRMYEGVGQLIVIGLINLCLGGMIGVVFVIFDFVIRDMVLSNRHLFEKKVVG